MERYRLYFARFGEGLGQLFSQLVVFNLDSQMEATVVQTRPGQFATMVAHPFVWCDTDRERLTRF